MPGQAQSYVRMLLSLNPMPTHLSKSKEKGKRRKLLVCRPNVALGICAPHTVLYERLQVDQCSASVLRDIERTRRRKET